MRRQPTLTTLSEINHAEIRESDRRNNRVSERRGLLLPTRNLRPPNSTLIAASPGATPPRPVSPEPSKESPTQPESPEEQQEPLPLSALPQEEVQTPSAPPAQQPAAPTPPYPINYSGRHTTRAQIPTPAPPANTNGPKCFSSSLQTVVARRRGAGKRPGPQNSKSSQSNQELTAGKALSCIPGLLFLHSADTAPQP